jgi:hypothetical protein
MKMGLMMSIVNVYTRVMSIVMKISKKMMVLILEVGLKKLVPENEKLTISVDEVQSQKQKGVKCKGKHFSLGAKF